MMSPDQLIQTVAIAAIPVLFAITLHEAAHGMAAHHFGDMTARRSLNPVHYIDPVGTVLLPIVSLWLGGILFGWARTFVNYGALRHPKKDMFWVSLAGPAANLLMAVFWALCAKVALNMEGSYFAVPLALMAKIGIQINVILVVLNLLPLPPLDGGHAAMSLLPHRQAYQLAKLEPYGFIILIILLVTNVLGLILWPAIGLLKGLLYFIFGL
jgi:Zn-dependent protease